MTKTYLSPIKEIIKEAKKGKMFILVDDKDRENEGDLVIPGSKCNSKNINFMATHGRGLICLALTKNKVEELNLPLMSSLNKARMQTAFTVSIEAKKGITTGISAFDRAKTIKTAINKKSKKKDIVSPGHVFPLVSRSGGVLERAGHTEASVDISKLAKLNPSAVICEVMNQDGRMARLKDLRHFSKKHKLKIASIEDLISFRLKNEKLIQNISVKNINLKKNKYEFIVYKNLIEKSLSYVIKKGNFVKNKSIRVRVLSKKMKDYNLNFKDKKIRKTLNYLAKFNDFALVIIKDQKSEKQKIFEETKNNNILRYYGIGAQIIKDLGVKKMILVSRSKKKIIGLDGYGIKIIKQEIIK
tara:strand:+ start:136 stop:1206 length:1071 start_codon:yes stop_codon:yes gene_type:complete